VNDFQRFVEDLQRQIEEEERALYSARVIKHARDPQNIGRLEPADGSATITGPCGDTMEIYLRLGEGGIIRQAAFMTDGCGPALACGSMISILTTGLSPEKALLISVEELIRALGGLPPESIHCAELSVNTLRAAVADLQKV
jgi:nitrogen fixation NifU-like protein